MLEVRPTVRDQAGWSPFECEWGKEKVDTVPHQGRRIQSHFQNSERSLKDQIARVNRKKVRSPYPY